MLAQKLMAAMAGGAEELFVDDVFSTFLYTGNGSTQTITNGIDLAGKGGMVWLKKRSNNNATARNHWLFDTARNAGNALQSNSTAANNSGMFGQSFSGSGFGLNSSDDNANSSTETYASWTFRKSPKFFDVVTYTGDGVAGRQIAHSLGVAPGMVIVKRTDAAGQSWVVWHRSTGNAYLYLNGTNASAADDGTFFGNGSYTAPTQSAFSVSANAHVNTNGATYVAYLFAHDTSAEGIIQCGSFTTDGSGNATVNLGWEPQWLLVKATDNAVQQWNIVDNMRGFSLTDSKTLFPNLSNAETNLADQIRPSATGFSTHGFGGAAAINRIYLAIRRPNKPPTTGTQVYNAIARTGTGAAATVTGVGFAPDLVLLNPRTKASWADPLMADKLRGVGRFNRTNLTEAETVSATSITDFLQDGVGFGANNIVNNSIETYINHFFRRAPGVFDVVCWTGDGASSRSVNHSLSVAPEFIVAKGRSAATGWFAYLPSGNVRLQLNSTSASPVYGGALAGTTPTSSTFSFDVDINANGSTYVAYLFATKAGISKVGSYTGNGGSQTINCGFTTGARFVLIKAASTTGNWTVIDTARGLVAGSDPYLALNSTAAEVTGEDCVDPDGTGFIVNNTAAALNTNGVTYIYLAFA